MKTTILTLGAILAAALVAYGATVNERTMECKADLVMGKSYLVAANLLEMYETTSPVVASAAMANDGIPDYVRPVLRPLYEQAAWCVIGEDK